MKNTNVDMLAGGRDLNAWEPTQIFAGESPITTDNGVAAADIEMYQPVYREDETGKLRPYDSVASAQDPKIYPVGISAQAAKAGESVPFYTGGTFNYDAITWPDTFADVLAAKLLFETHQATIIIKKLY